MSDTDIEWADKVWNPTIGCDRVSAGCDRCYAVGVAHRFSGSTAAFAGTTERRDDRTDWTGRVNLLGDDRITVPLRWRKGCRVFVNSMSDLFHADVPDEFIVRVFAVMAAAAQHTFQLLTKRHARMRSLLNAPVFTQRVMSAARELGLRMPTAMDGGGLAQLVWPLPNVWLGTSVENQHWADIRIPTLLGTPAAVRWISAEPLLGPLDLKTAALRPYEREQGGYWLYEQGKVDAYGNGKTWVPAPPAQLDWVVVGGESGPGCRPMHPQWARDIRDRCQAAGVPFLFKQHGGWAPVDDRRDWVAGARWIERDGSWAAANAPDPRTSQGWDDGHARGLQLMQLRSKKRNGHLLDGREHLEYPA